MSSFDRKSTSGGSSKKPIIAAALAVVLAVVLVRYFAKAQPTDAAVAPGAGPAQAVPISEENTAEAIRSLADDPTAKWLRGGAEDALPIDRPPQDPFEMSSEWRASLLKPVPAATVTTVVAVAPSHTGDPVKPVAVAWDPSSLKLQGVFKDSHRSFAIVNGSIVNEGMVVAGAKILEVRESSVICQPLGAADGVSYEVMLKNRTK